MGIARGLASLLCESVTEFHISGKILELGKQGISLNIAHLSRVLNKYGLTIPETDPKKTLTDVDFFKALGFQTVESLDANSYEGADHIHDFNVPVPEYMKGQYDLIFDGGTLEHIFDFPQSLRNIFDLLKQGGVVVHAVPSHNHVDHGFYMFSPTLFYDYYAANHFKILKSYIFEYQNPHSPKSWRVYEYTPDCIEHLSMGGWGKGMLGIFFVAQKVELSTADVVPQQGWCLKMWDEKPLTEGGVARPSNARGLKKWIKWVLTLPGVRVFSNTAYSINDKGYRFFKRHFKGRPPLVGLY